MSSKNRESPMSASVWCCQSLAKGVHWNSLRLRHRLVWACQLSLLLISYSEVYWFYFNVKYVWKFHETLLTEKMIKCSIHLSRGSGWSERRPHRCLPQPVPSTIQVKKPIVKGVKLKRWKLRLRGLPEE